MRGERLDTAHELEEIISMRRGRYLLEQFAECSRLRRRMLRSSGSVGRRRFVGRLAQKIGLIPHRAGRRRISPRPVVRITVCTNVLIDTYRAKNVSSTQPSR